MPTNPDELNQNPTAPVVGSIVQLNENPDPAFQAPEVQVQPALEPSPAPAPEAQVVAGDVGIPANPDMSGFNSCFRCGREKVGNVKLTNTPDGLLCNVCLPE